MTEAVYIAGAAFLLNAGGVIWALAWNARGIKSHVDMTMAAHDATMVRMMNEHQVSDTHEFALLRREFGETGAALRQKINEVELWNRDNFVRRDTFSAVTASWHGEVRTRFEKIDEKIDRVVAGGREQRSRSNTTPSIINQS